MRTTRREILGRVASVVLILRVFSVGAAAVPRVLLPGADQEPGVWRYTTAIPNYGWHLPDFDPSVSFRGAAWDHGVGGFGSPGVPNAFVGTVWETPNLWLRRTFHLGDEAIQHPHVRIGHNEHAEVYLNGYLAAKVAEGDGRYRLVPVSRLARATLSPGTNVIAVHAHRTGGGAYVDVGFVDVPAGDGAGEESVSKEVAPVVSNDPGTAWPVERARAWYAGLRPIRGCNYLPRTAVNSVEMWREETFDPGTIDEELGWAAAAGYNSVRVFLQYVVWAADPEGFARRLETFLDRANAHGITTMPVFFDDVCFAMKLEPILGPQDEPVPGVHNSGWVPSPGYSMVQDPSEWPALEAYVKDVVGRHRQDPRVLVWDVYNEPGPYFDSTRSFPLARAAVGWVRAVEPDQPVTIAVWGNPRSREFLEISDVLSLHTYGGAGLEAFFLDAQERHGRPVLVTECLARPGFGFATMLPVFARYRAGWYNWGLVAGRTQTHRAWSAEPEGSPSALWHHDVLHPDGTPYDPEEITLIQRFTFDERSPRVVVPTSLREGQSWRWTISQPAGDWAEPGFDDSAWPQGLGGFGHPDTPGGMARTPWVSDDLWIRRTFELGEEPLRDLRLRIQHDEDAEVYVNGRLAARVRGYNTYYATIPMTSAAAETLRPGENVLAVHCRQTSGGQFVDVGMVAEEAESDLESQWRRATKHGFDSQQAVRFARRYAHGWLSYADPQSGLLPRTIDGAEYWNAQDCAADNFPFLVLTAVVLDDYYLKQASSAMLEAERRLTLRVDGLPDTFDFAKQGFLEAEPDLGSILFGASEYVKDGLMPITEWMGPTPWEDRMLELLYAIWRHADWETPAGPVPTRNLEVHGELLQSMSRMYWRTGDERFRTWCFRLADLYLRHDYLLDHEQIRLRDHGCEVISGLSEAYVIATRKDPERRERYRQPLHAILDDILDHGVNTDGMMPNAYRPRSSGGSDSGLSDGWGYVYNAFLTVAEVDDVPRYREAVRHALQNVHKYLDATWEGRPADGYADSVEGALNLLNRVPVASAFEWAEQSIRRIWALQRPDGIIEGWYGDGNSARTTLLFALWKTQGVAAAPWRDDLRLGAVRRDDGMLILELHSAGQWTGVLRFDRPRHRDWLKLPADYPRINQFPEWFVAEADAQYLVRIDAGSPRALSGQALRSFPLQLKPDQTVRITVQRKESP